MRLKKIIGKIHLWLGLTSGIIVFILAITGCIYAFQMEISDLAEPYRFVEPQNKPKLSPSQMHDIAVTQLPGKHPHGVSYEIGNRSSVVSFYSADPEYYYLVYINPYTGEVLKVKNMDNDFFRFILMGHFYLWLPEEIGQPVVAYSTLIFVVMMISGLILWWPKNKAGRKQRFSIKWNARWRRVNYDLHNVLGFYMTWVTIIIALTGLVWGFQWFQKGLYATAGGEKKLEFTLPVSDTTQIANAVKLPVDLIYERMKKEHPEAASIEVHFPETPASAMEIAINPEQGTYWKGDYRYFDQYTLNELSVDHIYGRFKDTDFADKLIRANYDVHTGAIIGLPGKILAFCASLIAASLPITGFMIWRGRRRKIRKSNPAPSAVKKEVLEAV